MLKLIIFLGILGSVLNELLKIKILHTNDMFSKFHEVKLDGRLCNSSNGEKCYGGLARVYTYIENQRAGTKNTLFLNAGNTCGGNIYFYIHESKIVVDILNLLLPDAGIIGSSDFQLSGLAENLSVQLKYPIILSNLEKNQLQNVKSHHIIEISGYKVGIIGYTRKVPYNFVTDLVFKSAIETLNYESLLLIAKGVKTIVAIGNTKIESHLTVVRNCPFVDLVVSGYSTHKPKEESHLNFMKEYPLIFTNANNKKIPIIYADKNTIKVGDFDIEIDTQTGQIKKYGGKQILLDSSIKQHQKVLDLLSSKYDEEVEIHRRRTAGTTFINLDNDDGACKKRECNLGNAFADAILKYYVTHIYNYRASQWTDHSIVILSGESFAFSINEVEIYDVDTILDAYPSLDQIVSVKLLGKYLNKILNRAVEIRKNGTYPYFLQIGGLRVEYDVRKPKTYRLLYSYALCTNCTVPIFEKILKHQYYNVLVPSNLFLGALDYDWFLEKGTDVQYISKLPLYRIVVESLETKELYAEVDGRIKIFGENLAPIIQTNFWIFTFIIFFNKIF